MSISSSNLRFLNRAVLIWSLVLAALSSVAGTAFAAPWSIAPELDIPKSEDKRLHVRTPEITSGSDLKTILVAIALRHPFANLWVEKSDAGYVVRGKPAVPVAKIEFKLAPLALSAQLRAIITPYVGQVHSPKLQEKISLELQDAISKRGYVNGRVINLIKETPEEVVYIFKLDIGQPCIIAGFSWEQKPPIMTDQSIHVGDICDVDDVARSIAETESKARSLGYAESNLAFDGFQLDSTRTAAIIKIKGRCSLTPFFTRRSHGRQSRRLHSLQTTTSGRIRTTSRRMRQQCPFCTCGRWQLRNSFTCLFRSSCE